MILGEPRGDRETVPTFRLEGNSAMERELYKRLGRVAAVCLGLFGAILLLNLFYRCPFYALSGIPCAGCGMTRAFFALLHLDLASAFHWHPAVFPLAGCAVYAVACCIFGRLDLAKSQRLWGGMGILMLLIWFLRLPGFFSGSGALPVLEYSLGGWLLGWLQ